jgi:hypothetical protein
MQLTFQSFQTAVSNACAAVQSTCATILDFNPGSVFLAIQQGSASLMMWLQFQAALVLQATRLSTSQGADVDSFIADYGLTRAAGVAATGPVVFSRLSATQAAFIAPYVVTTNSDGTTTVSGVSVKTIDGTQSFGVYEDTTNSLWNTALGGYVIPIGTASGTIPVQALTAGTGGNVAAGTVGLISTNVAGVDSVTNAVSFTNGVNAASDPSVRQTFQAFFGSLARGTQAAILYAVGLVQQNLTAQVVETTGSFSVYFDDGSGNPPSATQNAVYASVNAYRAFGIPFSVYGPTTLAATVVMTVVAQPGYTSANLVGPVAAAVTAYINALPMGTGLNYLVLAAVAYNSTPGIADIIGYTLNGGTADLASATGQIIRVTTAPTVNAG